MSITSNRKGEGEHLIEPTAEDDPVIVYDTMRECANRLRARIIARASAAGEDPTDALIAVERRIGAVDIDDLDAQRALYNEFKQEREALAAQ